jgi:hypothetical protein
MKGEGAIAVEEVKQNGKAMARIMVRELKDFAAVSIREG